MKRKLALFLALVMIVSLLPMNVFAATSNRTDRTVNVSDSYSFDTAAKAVNLRIQEENTGEFVAGRKQIFELQLENAEWLADSAATMKTELITNITGTEFAAGIASTTTDIVFTKLTSKRMEVSILVTTASVTDKSLIKLPILAKATDKGELKVTVNNIDGNVSSGTYTFGTAAGGDTTFVPTDDDDKFADAIVLDDIIIEETKIGSLSNAGTTAAFKFRLTLKESGFKFVEASESLVFGSGFNSVNSTATFKFDADTTGDDKFIDIEGVIPASRDYRGKMIIKGLKVKATSDARIGDVNMKISNITGGFTEETVKVAEYVTYGVTVKADGDPKTIYSGDFKPNQTNTNADGADFGLDTGFDVDEHKLAKLIIEEEVANSWLTGRKTIIDFGDNVKILRYQIKKLDNFVPADTSFMGTVVADETANEVHTKNQSKVELVNWGKSDVAKKNALEVIFWVSVEADYEGDIVAEVSGSALDKETKVVLGKAVKPASFTSTSKDVRIGLQNQPVGDIVITEPAAGKWDAGSTQYIEVSLPSGFKWKEKPSVEVTKGDVILYTDKIKVSGDRHLRIPVKYESNTASELTLKGGTVTLDRTVPEGDFKVSVGGTSLVDNYNSDEVNGTFNTDTVGSQVIARVITPTDYDTKATQAVVFTIDNPVYKVGDLEVTSDAAPFIDANGRTLLPVRAFSNALGVANDNIIWNDAARSVTIFKGDRVVKLVIGQNLYTVNGVQVEMDTQAVIVNGRTFIPVRALATALGAEVQWDAATRTVTVQ